jgi:EpsI family protein
MKKKNIYLVIACAILIIAGLYLRIPRGETGISPSQPIADFPFEFSVYRGENIFSYNNYNSSADQRVQRVYKKEGVDMPVDVSLEYWASQNETKRVVSPRYTGSGWEYYWIKTRTLSIDSGPVNLKEFLNERGSEKELVYYCYIIDGKIISDEYQLRLSSFLNSLLYGRSNIAVLRVSMPVTEQWSVENAESFQENFLKALLPILREYI